MNHKDIIVLEPETARLVHNMWLKAMGFPEDRIPQSPATIKGYIDEYTSGPGTMSARFTALCDELEKRFPLKNRYLSIPDESQHLDQIDSLIAKVKDLEKANEAWGEAWSELLSEKTKLEIQVGRLLGTP